MMYKFKSHATGDLIMMKPVGDQVLRLIGKEPAESGIIPVASMPAAIAAIEHAVAADGSAADHDLATEQSGDAAVGLHQRAWPLLDMMKRSLAEDADIVWGV